jgi:hypothetical protein
MSTAKHRDAWTKVIEQQQLASKHKYHAKPKMVDGIRFASTAEARRYQELKMLEHAGEVTDLELQPKFPIYVCGRRNGELVKVCTYIADFRYRKGPTGLLVIEDVKGVRTPVYRLKRKMVEAQYDIRIQEV